MLLLLPVCRTFILMMKMASINEEAVLQAPMLKRSQSNNRLKSVNYKSRWFVLTKACLRYHDGKPDGKEKGRLDLRTVRLVERVDDGALEREKAFQIGYKDRLMYIVASSEAQREEWIIALRKLCVNNEQLADKFHSGVWSGGRWGCCGRGSRGAPGCRSTLVTAPHSAESLNSRGSITCGDPVPARTKDILPIKGTVATKLVTALYSFQAIEKGDLSLEAGKEYIVLDDTGEHWWQVKDKNGAVGFIPSNYVEEKAGLWQHEWYAGDMSRQRAEQILRQETKEGAFVIRNSSTHGLFTLSLLANSPNGVFQVKHYHIKSRAGGHLYLSERRSFPSLEDLVRYHRHDSGGLATRLRHWPAQLRRTAPTAGLGHDKWEIDPSELTLLEELGSGQFGVVRRGKWRGCRDVAVKMMKEGTMSEDDFIEEAKLMTKLQHPNLVQLYGVCSKHRPIFIVAEYMKHGSLLQFLRRHERALSEKGPVLLLDICLQVASGMAYLELHNYIHRDLAARNCLVGENYVVKVADFGLARYVIDDEYTSSGGAKFPIKWAPPEVLGYTRFSSKSDVWAYGVLMWEVFTCGKIPYGRAANAEVVEQVQHGQRLARPPACPSDVYQVMRSCWEKKPDARPSFRSITSQLEKVMDKDH
ncbi:tyrosine-protein kinase Btk isoform X1 [Dermacentor andersoni]|uniref:tyrosine-protein kinase Btk isoform X1 n=2 Tax=Dermacentor andersoni TaxID=34620 RepID=UPI00241786B4|nr:tyrosine-protein kinase Btk29A-like isoform X1 [Dermacentor andersoni]